MFTHIMQQVMVWHNPKAALIHDNGALFATLEVPNMKLALADIPDPFNDPALTTDLTREMDCKIAKAIAGSHGLVVNSFPAMEHHYIEHWDQDISQRPGPLARSA